MPGDSDDRVTGGPGDRVTGGREAVRAREVSGLPGEMSITQEYGRVSGPVRHDLLRGYTLVYPWMHPGSVLVVPWYHRQAVYQVSMY